MCADLLPSDIAPGKHRPYLALALAAVLAMAVSVYAQDSDWKAYVDAGEQLFKQHQYAEADKDFEKALAEAQHLGLKDQRLALVLYDLGSSYAAQKRFSEADPLLKRSLEIRKDFLGSEHLDVAQSQYRLGLVCAAQSKFDQAEPLLRDSLAIREKELGPTHPDVADSLYVLATILTAEHKGAEAEPFFKRSLAIREKLFGPESPQVANVLEVYAALLRYENRAFEAQTMEVRAKAIRGKLSSPAVGQTSAIAEPTAPSQAGQPSIADVARQVRAAKEQRSRQEKSIQVYEGQLSIAASPKFTDSEKQTINQTEILVRNSSRRDYRYVFTVKCGAWTKKVSSNLAGSAKGLSQKPILLDVPIPCDWSALTLDDFKEAQGLEGPEPQPSKVPGIDDAEVTRREATRKQMAIGSPSSVDAVAAAQARVDRACKYDLTMTPAQITSTMTDCDNAYGELESATKAQATTESKAGQAPTAGDYVVSLTGTSGLPVTGSCSFAGKSVSFDDVLPAEHVVAGGRGVLCSFVKKYVDGTLRMQIIQNGVVRDQAETTASYGVVSLTVDW